MCAYRSIIGTFRQKFRAVAVLRQPLFLFYFRINRKVIAGIMIIIFFVDYFVIKYGKTAGKLHDIIYFFTCIFIIEIIECSLVFVFETLPDIGKVLFCKSEGFTVRIAVEVAHYNGRKIKLS